MTVLMVEPGYVPYEKTIPNTLEAKQELVGGLITAIYPYEEMVAIVANARGNPVKYGLQPQRGGRLWRCFWAVFRVRTDGG